MKMVLRCFILIFGVSQMLIGCKTSNTTSAAATPKTLPAPQVYRLAFYNVENLFDTLDDPHKLDDEFTPSGKNKWTTERYQKKLSDLARVIGEMGCPEVFGLTEVENKSVLADLTQAGALASRGYRIVHYDSPDERGIDVALLYREPFRPSGSHIIRLQFPLEGEEVIRSRDVLVVEGQLDGQPVQIFVNHWPSRRDGLAKSELRRVFAAQTIRHYLDSVRQAAPAPNFIVMGDFNDEPGNRSIREVLGAEPMSDTIVSGRMYNLFSPIWERKEGSYNYRGNWNTLDQIMVSAPLLDRQSSLQVRHAEVFRKDWMLYQDPKFGLSPNRTYGGPNYYGGISDHLPVMAEIWVSKK
jgi:predicted extracellular nuclease